jgi:YVTN family beta-propeller protein
VTISKGALLSGLRPLVLAACAAAGLAGIQGGSAAAAPTTPPGTYAYVTDLNGGDVKVINTATNAVTATIGVGSGPIGVAVSADGKRVYVTNSLSNTISVIDATTETVAAP